MKIVKSYLRFIAVFAIVVIAFSSTSFAASVGGRLPNPESGWQRIDDSDKKINYIGNWTTLNNGSSAFWKGTMKYVATKSNNDTVSFRFYGTKLRIIAQPHSARTDKVQVKIDNTIVGNYNIKGDSSLDQTLLFDKIGLERKVHNVELLNLKPESLFVFDAIDIDSDGYLVDYIQPTTLTAIAGNAKVDLSWDAIEGITSYHIKRSTTLGGIYEIIATNSTATYTDTSVKNGTTYYYVVTAVDSNGEGTNSNEVSATPISSDITLEVTSVDKAKIGDEILANIVIHNASNICAEDIKIAFDTTKLDFISAENADGMKIYKEDDLGNGIKRYITASLGKTNAANGEKILLVLKFKAKAIGEAKIDILNGRIADNATLEVDVDPINCGEKIVLIEGVKDINRSGEFTLLDLGISAWYYGDAAETTDTTKYDADIIPNGTIDDDDLIEVVRQILNNKNYFIL